MKSNIFLIFCLGISSAFEIYWNVPTNQCRKYQLDFVSLLRIYGIQVNDKSDFKGDKITIFYEEQLGLYPRIVKGEKQNGGIPQKGNLVKHLKKAAKDIDKDIPSKDFNGLGVIDWESWRPIWEFNWSQLRIYQTASLELAKELHPTLSKTAIQAIAKRDWEKNAKLYMLETLQMAKKLRPNAVWGFYLFPDCYNYEGNKSQDFQCSANVRKENDRLSYLWEESTALYPSIYVQKTHLDKYTFQQRSWRDNEKLGEALRVASPNAKIYPYVNYHKNKLLPQEEVWRMLAQTAATGCNGAILWGPSASVASKRLCKDLMTYIIETLGPASEKVAYRANLCSKQICNSRGYCTFPKDDNANKWRLFTDDTENFYAGDITCRCFENNSGRFCENSI